MLVPGTASQSLSAALAAELDEALAPVEFERFPDGELLARAPLEDADRAVVVAATTSSDTLIELLQLQDAASRQVDEVVTVLPYMGYARQDRAFEEGDPVSARAVARAVSAGTDRVLTVTPHEPDIAECFDVPCEVVDAAGRLAEPLPDDLADPLFLAPDEAAESLAATVRNAHGTGETDHFGKSRISDTEVEMAPNEVDIAGRDVVLVDDIVATGSTMSEAIGHIRGDANRVYVTCVHPMLAGSARTRLARAGVGAVHGTDTIERAESSVSVAPVIAAHL